MRRNERSFKTVLSMEKTATPRRVVLKGCVISSGGREKKVNGIKAKSFLCQHGIESCSRPGRRPIQDFSEAFEEREGTNKDEIKPTAYMTGKKGVDNDWIVDSGSNEHITHEDGILDNITKTHFENPILIPIGDVITVEGKESCSLPGGTKSMVSFKYLNLLAISCQ